MSRRQILETILIKISGISEESLSAESSLKLMKIQVFLTAFMQIKGGKGREAHRQATNFSENKPPASSLKLPQILFEHCIHS